jgi:hypothetical protein
MATTDEIYDGSPQTIREHVIYFLVRNGMFVDDAEKVFEIYKQEDDGCMKERWDDKMCGYPPQFEATIMLGINRIVLKYIEEHMPKAWFRPMFE